MFKRVSKSGMTLQDAAEELKGDREIVMEAVSENGHALQHATEELKADPEIVMRAVSHDGYALRYASQELKSDKEMMQHALRQGQGLGALVGLKVVLLSGRCCTEIFYIHSDHRRRVLRRCAELLDLDPDHVERRGALMRGIVEVQEGTKLHESILVAVASQSIFHGASRAPRDEARSCCCRYFDVSYLLSTKLIRRVRPEWSKRPPSRGFALPPCPQPLALPSVTWSLSAKRNKKIQKATHCIRVLSAALILSKTSHVLDAKSRLKSASLG